ncbi:translation initiation factor IF-2 [Miltoncostaea marina]|uniref:translation initiation factor IF-2 n=1 Tax=Miltoncostaea marina TaxID=2843215 RepID=UPI001FE49025|nr:translation initiation factor IF-2 [Miltoncostaea marina]
MMEKKRIYEIAKEEGLPSSLLLQRLQRAGVDVKTASSTVDVAEALHVLNPNRYPKPERAPEPPKPARPPRQARPGKPRAATPEAPVAEAPAAPRAETPARPSPRPAAARPAETPAAEAPAPARPAPAPAPAAPDAPAPAAPAEPAAPAAPEAPAPAAEAPAAPAAPERPAAEAPAAPAAPERPAAEAPAPEAPAAPEPAAPEQPTARQGAPAPTPPRRGVPGPPKPPIYRPPPVPAGNGGGRPGGPAGRPGGGPGGPGRPGGGPGRPGGPGGPGGGGPRGKRRRVVIDPQAGRRGPAPQRDRRGRGGGPRQEEKPAVVIPPSEMPPVDVPSGSTVKDFAEILGIGTAQIIKLLMGLGELATITQSLSDEAIELIAAELERKVDIVHAEEEAERAEEFEDDPADLQPRAPVVAVMGHVDHGKTSLLDAIRSTEVAAGEAGGITQHIGAYQVHHGDREITFLDTPGHEAFTAMRARGAKITDVAVIVVAADDGVMPQTVEAIDHAKAAEVPFMVAVNKIDKPGANPDRVKQELSQQEVIPSEWGGTHEFVEVSALEGTGIDSLLETVLLVADADAEPKANPKPEASGTVIESRLDPGRGPVASLLVQRGTLRIGDVIVAGDVYGRVRAMADHTGAAIEAAAPSVPVEILGLGGVVDAGERFRVVENEREARQRAAERNQRLRAEELANRRPVSLDDLFARIKEGGLKELNIIIKGDVQGSVGALEDALNKVEQTEVRLNVIRTGVGAITESDVMLASASEAVIIGFNVRPRPEAGVLAEREGVDVRTYRVIYRAIEDVRDALVGLLEPDIVEDVIGHLEVRQTFRASRIGTIAGCYVTDGVIRRSARVRVVRDGTVVHEGRIASLKRFNEDTREVAQGFECGVLVEDFNDVKEGDALEVFELREVARTAQAAAPAAPAAAPAPEPAGDE